MNGVQCWKYSVFETIGFPTTRITSAFSISKESLEVSLVSFPMALRNMCLVARRHMTNVNNMSSNVFCWISLDWMETYSEAKHLQLVSIIHYAKTLVEYIPGQPLAMCVCVCVCVCM